MHQHLVNHIHHAQLRADSTLHVVVVVSNPVRFHSRYRLARQCIERLHRTPNCKVHVVEAAFGDRHHELRDSCEALGVNFLGLRTRHELWHKENMINLAVRDLLPRNWKYLAWVDADVFWPDNSDGTPFNWPLETIHQLQHHSVVQPWKDCLDLGFNGDIMLNERLQPMVHTSFCFVHTKGVPKQTHSSQPYKYAHSGFAWACTREFWENVGGLMDWCIVGSADHHMAFALINQVHVSVHGKMPEEFKRKAREWQHAAYRMTQGNLGFVRTRIDHRFHGSKAKRFYRERWEIFIQHKFNPYTDLGRDAQGLLYLIGKPGLESDIRSYMRSRMEDSIDE